MEAYVRDSETLSACSWHAKYGGQAKVLARTSVLLALTSSVSCWAAAAPPLFDHLVASCAPLVHPATARALVAVESGFNPYAIGVVRGALDRQPRNRLEAIATAEALSLDGWIYSVGLAQINSRNFARLGLTPSSAFDPCMNLRAMQAVLSECLRLTKRDPQLALRRALSCYYSGSPETGMRDGYVARVIAAARSQAAASSQFYPSFAKASP